MAFDTLGAARRLREGGADEPLAEAIVDVISDATAELLTREYFDQRTTQFEERMAQLEEGLTARTTLHERSLSDRMTRHEQGFSERVTQHEQSLSERMTLHEQSFSDRMDARFEAMRAEMYRAAAIQGGVILGGVGVIVALVETLN